MITVLLHMMIRPGRENDFRNVARSLTTSTIAEDRGCLAYRYFTGSDDNRKALLFEQWEDADSLDAHVARLRRVIGPPDENEPFPGTHHRRRLPKAFLDLFETTDAIRYDPVDDVV